MKNHSQWANLTRTNTTQGTAVHVMKKRAQAEVVLAEGLLSSYAISQAINDESNMLVGLFENYTEHLKVDIASNPQLVGVDLEVPGGAGSQLANSSGIANGSRLQQSQPQQQEAERRRAEEERARKAREDEAEKERIRLAKEDEDRKKRNEEAEAARIKAEIAAQEEKKRKDERERLAEAALQKEKQAEEERVAKLKAKQMEEELKLKEEQLRQQEDRRKISSESSEPFAYSQSNRGGAREAGELLRGDVSNYPNAKAKEPKLISNSPFGSGPVGRYGDRDESVKSTFRQVQEESARLQELKNQYSEKKRQQASVQPSSQQPNELAAPRVAGSATELMKMFGSQTLLNKAISIEEERQAQRDRLHKEREMNYIEKYEQMKKESREVQQADSDKIVKLREELMAVKERKKRMPIWQLAATLPDKDSPQTRMALQRIEGMEDELIQQLETLTKKAEDVAILHTDIHKESSFFLGKQKGTLLNLDKQKELQAEIFTLKQQKENLQLQALNLKRQLEEGVQDLWRDPEVERKQNLENSIKAMNRLNQLKTNELNRNKALLEALDSEYREFLKNPKYTSTSVNTTLGQDATLEKGYVTREPAVPRTEQTGLSQIFNQIGTAEINPKYSGYTPNSNSMVRDFRNDPYQHSEPFEMTDFSRGLQDMLGQFTSTNTRR